MKFTAIDCSVARFGIDPARQFQRNGIARPEARRGGEFLVLHRLEINNCLLRGISTDFDDVEGSQKIFVGRGARSRNGPRSS